MCGQTAGARMTRAASPVSSAQRLTHHDDYGGGAHLDPGIPGVQLDKPAIPCRPGGGAAAESCRHGHNLAGGTIGLGRRYGWHVAHAAAWQLFKAWERNRYIRYHLRFHEHDEFAGDGSSKGARQ